MPSSKTSAFRAIQQSYFPLPAHIFWPVPAFGTSEFVNLVTLVGIIVAVALVGVDLVLRVAHESKSQRRRRRNPKKTLDGATKVDLKLSKKEQISPDTIRLTFALPSPQHVLGLPVGQHVGLSYVDAETGDRVERPYTPVSSDDDLGVAVFVIKVYKPCEKFPEGGKVSQYLDSLVPGKDVCTFSGPKGMKQYAGRGTFLVKRLKSQGGGFEKRAGIKRVGMIAGGSGITPMLQVSRAILDGGDTGVKMNLLFANQTEADILCREEIEADVEKHGAEKFSAHYTLDRPPKKWAYSSGFITKEMIQEHMPPPGKGTQILICGPPPMLKFAVLPALEALGYTKDMYLTW